MKMRFAGSLVLLGFCVAVSLAQEDKSPEQIAKAKAEEAAQATIKGDFDKYITLTYPKIIQKMGGVEKAKKKLEDGFADMKKKGFAFKSAKVGEPSQAVTGGNDLYLVIPMTLEMTAPNSTITLDSFVIGISSDKGKSWTFVDGSKATDKHFKEVVPKLPAALKLPKTKEPVVKKKDK
jgi:hypothetical protein